MQNKSLKKSEGWPETVNIHLGFSQVNMFAAGVPLVCNKLTANIGIL